MGKMFVPLPKGASGEECLRLLLEAVEEADRKRRDGSGEATVSRPEEVKGALELPDFGLTREDWAFLPPGFTEGRTIEEVAEYVWSRKDRAEFIIMLQPEDDRCD